MQYKQDWRSAQDSFKAWWSGSEHEKPLIKVVASDEAEEPPPLDDPLDADAGIDRVIERCRNTDYLAGAFPSLDLDMGTLAAYFGVDLHVEKGRFIVDPAIQDWDVVNFRLDNSSEWLSRHLEEVEKASELLNGDIPVNIPNLSGGLDVLADLKGSVPLMYDIVAEPELMKELVEVVDDIFLEIYERFYRVVRASDGSSSFAGGDIWAPGRVAVIQSSMSTYLSPALFRDFVVPSIVRRCKKIDNCLFLIDGTANLRHLDVLLEIRGIHAFQWSPPPGLPDSSNEQWYAILEQVRRAGKSILVNIRDGDVEDWLSSADRLFSHFGRKGVFVTFPTMSRANADTVMSHAEKHWKKK